MHKTAKIYIAGHRGPVGSAIHRNLLARGYATFALRTHAELDLENQAAVRAFFEAERPEYVFLAGPPAASPSDPAVVHEEAA